MVAWKPAEKPIKSFRTNQKYGKIDTKGLPSTLYQVNQLLIADKLSHQIAEAAKFSLQSSLKPMEIFDKKDEVQEPEKNLDLTFEKDEDAMEEHAVLGLRGH